VFVQLENRLFNIINNINIKETGIFPKCTNTYQRMIRNN
jgi:hypothetical protein